MRRKSLSSLGETEMEVLHHVWELSSATVADVHGRILKEREVAYTTVMTVMKKLSDKGYLGFEKDGATYVYSPARSPESVRSGLLGDVLEKVFHGSPIALVQTLAGHENLSEAERVKIQELIQSLGQEGGDD